MASSALHVADTTFHVPEASCQNVKPLDLNVQRSNPLPASKARLSSRLFSSVRPRPVLPCSSPSGKRRVLTRCEASHDANPSLFDRLSNPLNWSLAKARHLVHFTLSSLLGTRVTIENVTLRGHAEGSQAGGGDQVVITCENVCVGNKGSALNGGYPFYVECGHVQAIIPSVSALLSWQDNPVITFDELSLRDGEVQAHWQGILSSLRSFRGTSGAPRSLCIKKFSLNNLIFTLATNPALPVSSPREEVAMAASPTGAQSHAELFLHQVAAHGFSTSMRPHELARAIRSLTQSRPPRLIPHAPAGTVHVDPLASRARDPNPREPTGLMTSRRESSVGGHVRSRPDGHRVQSVGSLTSGSGDAKSRLPLPEMKALPAASTGSAGASTPATSSQSLPPPSSPHQHKSDPGQGQDGPHLQPGLVTQGGMSRQARLDGGATNTEKGAKAGYTVASSQGGARGKASGSKGSTSSSSTKASSYNYFTRKGFDAVTYEREWQDKTVDGDGSSAGRNDGRQARLVSAPPSGPLQWLGQGAAAPGQGAQGMPTSPWPGGLPGLPALSSVDAAREVEMLRQFLFSVAVQRLLTPQTSLQIATSLPFQPPARLLMLGRHVVKHPVLLRDFMLALDSASMELILEQEIAQRILEKPVLLDLLLDNGILLAFLRRIEAFQLLLTSGILRMLLDKGLLEAVLRGTLLVKLVDTRVLEYLIVSGVLGTLLRENVAVYCEFVDSGLLEAMVDTRVAQDFIIDQQSNARSAKPVNA
eukprot:jgi/Mesvir1/3085/Mv25858-RA.2